MGYDDWKTEAPEDYDWRMRTHFRGPSSLPPAESSGRCVGCGIDTSRSVGGVGWQCAECGEKALKARFLKDAALVTVPRI